MGFDAGEGISVEAGSLSVNSVRAKSRKVFHDILLRRSLLKEILSNSKAMKFSSKMSQRTELERFETFRAIVSSQKSSAYL